jgi:hypothetical protein
MMERGDDVGVERAVHQACDGCSGQRLIGGERFAVQRVKMSLELLVDGEIQGSIQQGFHAGGDFV